MSGILGIVAEYDPFHRGHEKHIRLARARVQPDFTYVAMSGCFRQRGEAAMLSPWDRAACALAAGADAVFLLPTVWTLRDAEHYALGGVSLLAGLGATHLAFGAETAETALLRRAAETLEDPGETFRARLRGHLETGAGYPRALELAMKETDPEAAGLLNGPNNLLGICYLRAIRRLGAEMTSVVIARAGGYRETVVSPENPSATSLRKAIRRGDYAAAFQAMPAESGRVIRQALLDGRMPDGRILDAVLLRRLRGMTRDEAARLPDVSEGLEGRILEAARVTDSRDALLDAACTKRYPKARISRICACAALGLEAKDISDAPLPQETLLLGMRRNPEMTARWRELKIRIASNPGELAPDPAWRLWGQAAGLPEGWERRQRVGDRGRFSVS